MKNNFSTQEQVHHERYCEGEPIGVFCLFVPLFSHLITEKYLLTATAVTWCLKWEGGLLGQLLTAQAISMQFVGTWLSGGSGLPGSAPTGVKREKV